MPSVPLKLFAVVFVVGHFGCAQTPTDSTQSDAGQLDSDANVAPVCTAGTKQCAGYVLQVCDVAGAAWAPVETCDCDCVVGACTKSCPPKNFGFSFYSFTGMPGEMGPKEFVQSFPAAMHNPIVFKPPYWYGPNDIRNLNRKGVYLKHINVLSSVPASSPYNAGDHPLLEQITNPAWIVRDSKGNPISAYSLPNEELTDFGNDGFLDWITATWLPGSYQDAVDLDKTYSPWLLQDNGHFYAFTTDCVPGDLVCLRYSTDTGVQDAWVHYLDRLRAAWPNVKIAINGEVNAYRPIDEQLAAIKKVVAHADGLYFEFLALPAFALSSDAPHKTKFIRDLWEMSKWLAANDKLFFPNVGLTPQGEPPKAEADFAWAFFNLLRQGNKQFFARVTTVGANWQPRVYPEMQLDLGHPLEDAQEISPDVFRRKYSKAGAYMNISAAPVSIDLPPLPNGTHYADAAGTTIASPLLLASFAGITLYRQ